MDTEYTGISYLWAAILGLVQGLTEFLPVSSSGHLALAQHLGLGHAVPAAFDVFLHLATLAVVVAYFRRGILWYAKNSPVVLLYVIVASIPAGVAGILCKKYLEALRQSPSMICLGLLATALALFVAWLHHGPAYQMRDLGLLGAATVGVCQALALAPGISRSGLTIAGAIICGIDRKEAFGFSFILSIPAVAGAALLHALEIAGSDAPGDFMAGTPIGPLLAGLAVAAASGYVALRVLEHTVARGRLAWFAGYCLLAATIGLAYFNVIA